MHDINNENKGLYYWLSIYYTTLTILECILCSYKTACCETVSRVTLAAASYTLRLLGHLMASFSLVLGLLMCFFMQWHALQAVPQQHVSQNTPLLLWGEGYVINTSPLMHMFADVFPGLWVARLLLFLTASVSRELELKSQVYLRVELPPLRKMAKIL